MMAGEEFRALTSLRGIAAMAVVIQHFCATAQTLCPVNVPSLVSHGYMAVDLFFVLSGFILAHTYLHEFQRRGLAAYPSFMARRIARIVPLNLAVVVLLLGLAAASTLLLGRDIFYDGTVRTSDLVANLLLLQGFGIGRNLNGPSWSVSVEFFAYLAFPAYLYLVFHRSAAVWIASQLLAACVLVMLATGQPRLAMLVGPPHEQVLRCFAEFAIGLGAYRCFCNPEVARALRGDRVGFAVFAAGLALLVVRIDLVLALMCPVVVITLASNQGRLAELMSGRTVHFLGVISFSIYLLHDPFRSIGYALIQRLHPAPLDVLSAETFAIIGSLSVIPFAWLTYLAIERPGRELGRRLAWDAFRRA